MNLSIVEIQRGLRGRNVSARELAHRQQDSGEHRL